MHMRPNSGAGALAAGVVEWPFTEQLTERKGAKSTMTLTLKLTQELEERLKQEASREGKPVEAYALELIGRHLRPDGQQVDLASLLESWITEGDAKEQRSTGDFLVRALDEDRPSDRPLFPPELKGITW